MTVLVTGGTGVQGAWVTRKLIEEKTITPIAFDAAPNTTLLKDIEGKFEMVRGNTTDFAHLARTVRKYNVRHIIHMAALTLQSEENPPLTLKVNTEGLINMLELARSFDIERVVHISSSAVYAPPRGEHGCPIEPIKEDYTFIYPNDDPRDLSPFALYAITKLTSEFYGLHYAKTYGIDFVAFRLTKPWGPGKMQFGRHSIGGSLFNCVIDNALLGKPTTIQGLEAKADWIYHKDIAKCLVLASYAQKPKHKFFNLGSGEGVTLMDLATAIKKIIPKAIIEVKPGPCRYYEVSPCPPLLDVSRARKELGFTPDYTLEESVKDYIETMKRFNMTPVYTPLE